MTDISMQTTHFGGSPDGRQPHWLPGPRPDDLPISAAVWDVAKNTEAAARQHVKGLLEQVGPDAENDVYTEYI